MNLFHEDKRMKIVGLKHSLKLSLTTCEHGVNILVLQQTFFIILFPSYEKCIDFLNLIDS